MKSYSATAPGKVILFGEHAVVYHRPAIAVPVTTVQARVDLQTSGENSGLRIIAPDLRRDYRFAEAEANDALALIIRLTLARFQPIEPPQATLTVTSTIPLGRGLGSGAAISTAVVRALAQFYGQPMTPAAISELVYEVEKLYHGTPSGIDNTVIAYEQPVYFIRQQPIERLSVGRAFTLVVGDTGRVSPTHKAVGHVRRQWEANPPLFEALFDVAGRIAVAARAIIEQGGSAATLGGLMNDNQAVLAAMGVSSPELDRLVEAARQAGAWGAKLSGAGWGGNMIALVEPEHTAAVAEALLRVGATGCIITEVAPS